MANWWDEIAGKGSRERLSNYYDDQLNQNIRKISEDYGEAKSKFNRGLFQRGMQRSSYGAATNANYDVKEATEKSNARTSAMAAFGRELNELDQWEQEYNEKVRQRELEEKKLAEQQRQFDEQMAWERELQAAKNAAAEAAAAASSGGGGGGGGYTTTPTRSDLAYVNAQNAANNANGANATNAFINNLNGSTNDNRKVNSYLYNGGVHR
jgi:DNA repair exonuclease SbcCD ATPase subunit